MLPLVILSALLLAVVVFALQNAAPVTVHFLSWRLEASVAVVTLTATASGALIAGLFGLASRLRRWRRGRVATGAARAAPASVEPGAPVALSPRGTD
jgi:uncharacterized integral membrane protein